VKTVTVKLLRALGLAVSLGMVLGAVFLPATAQAAGMTSTTTLSSVLGAKTGQPIVFTATVTNGTSTPTGNVTFTITDANSNTYSCDNGAANVIALAPNGGGSGSVAQCQIAAGLSAAPSPYAVTASYGGDGSDNPSSASISKTIKPGATSTTVTASSDPTVTGQPVSFTAMVAPVSPATGTPTGSVTFTITGADSPTDTANCDSGNGNNVALVSGSATCSVSGGLEATGTAYTISAVYSSGDANFSGSSGTASQTVTRGGATITVAQTTPSGTQPVTGQAVAFTATVATTAPATGTPTGSVIFTVTSSTGSNVNCDSGDTVSLMGGNTATCSLSAGLKGAGISYTVSATLSDTEYKTKVAGTLTITVARTTTVTTVSGLPGSVSASEPFSIGVKIAAGAPGKGKPAGFVTIGICLNGAATCGPEAGSGTFNIPTTSKTLNSNKFVDTVVGGLTPGFYAITATYDGSPNYESSASATKFLLVTTDHTTTDIVPSHSPVHEGGRLVLRAEVIESPTASGELGAPTGTVTLTVQGATGPALTCTTGSNVVTISTTSNNQGLAKCVIAAGQITQADGPYAVQAVYSGDSNYTTSTDTISIGVVPAVS
jgi:large repetitive protein